ncbi:MAG: histidine kinase [Clostridiales bacterium]|nr:histidine kinase [Clostridiales bacterium]
MRKALWEKILDRLKITKILDKLKLNEKFMIMYILCVIVPLVVTDVILFRSLYKNELENQSHYRNAAIEAYSNYLSNLLSYDADLSSAMDINKNLNSFINKWYSQPYDYYDDLVSNITSSYFSTLSDLNQDRLVIYSDNPTILSGNYFHKISEVENEQWYKEFTTGFRNETVYAYFETNPALKTFDQNRFIYVRRMNNVKSSIEKIITIEHKRSRISSELGNIPVNCSMYLCCGDHVVFASDGTSEYSKILEMASYEPYMTVRDYKMYGNTFTIYAFTKNLDLAKIIQDNIWTIILLMLFTLLFPVILMRLFERSITNRISILGKAFGEGSNKYFQPIKEISGSDEISSLMNDYNRIVDINNDLTNTIYKDKLRKQESDLARKNAELLALQSQINPHFMFNALESIRMHSILKGENETADMVQRLAVMERQNVEWNEDAVTIAEEEEFIAAYLELQSYRFGDRISFNIDIDDDCKKILIPKLTLVTFVENACVHGIESKAAQGWIFVRVYKNEDKLTIEVEDTGDGMDDDAAANLERKMNCVTIDMIKNAKHVGILNACLRIKMMFSNRAKFSVETEKGIGMSVIITIPENMLTVSD